MRPTKILLFLLLFSFCSTTETYRYELVLDDKIDEGLLTIDTNENSFINGSIVLSIQFFPKEPNSINFYDLTFDMKFKPYVIGKISKNKKKVNLSGKINW